MVSALQFFPLANSFHLKGIEQGLRRMLMLVWNQSPAIVKELIEVPSSYHHHSDHQAVVFLLTAG